MRPGLWQWIVCGLIAGTVTGCELPRDVTKTPRSATEQLLLSQALDRTLFDLFIPVSLQEPLVLEVTGLQSGYASSSGGDLLFVKDVVSARLGGLGYRMVNSESDASFIVRVVVQSFGTNQSTTFFGMPPIQSVLIPFSLPQLTLYQNLSQDGYIRYSLDVVERASGRLFYSTPWYHQRTFYDQYTVLFFITFRKTDLADAP